ncbi:hypothetical protein [Micromonospora sp. NBC_01796]|uniref:hypothetical protein n=1 Tax=Micromonospora sp. NBC_01796 TaxID=2975987 RepID=UPI002DDA77C6|nr:hypothetical protein [Micromonospora sp. NBC_01796]WSA83511.1 hypothetical protein OIE47_24330 [Micromonospora sp. NBC_01796]
MRLRKPTLTSVLAAASVAAMASAALAAPAYASAGSTTAAPPSTTCTYVDGTVCFWDSIWFDGPQVQYSVPLSTGCVNSPIEIHGHVNLTDKTLLLYRGADCTGLVSQAPPSDLHSSNQAIRSFRVA